MTRWLMVVGSIVAAAVAGSSAAAGGGLCVGGPHCFASIQAAVAAAHDGDTIHVGPGTYAGDVVVDKSVDLMGAGPNATTISGGRHVVTIGSTTSAPTVSITGVTITGGRATDNPQSPRCAADVPTCGPGYADATGLGGGIEAFQGTNVTIAHSVVTGNTAVPAHTTQSVRAVCPLGPCPASFGDGAGIDNWGAMTLVDTTVSDNHASAIQSNGGGILDEAGATMTIRNSRVLDNSATAAAPMGRFVSGGGIFVAGGDVLTVENSSIDGNVAALVSSIPHPFPKQGGNDAASSFGGGIFLGDGATATIANSTLNGNAVTVDAPLGEPVGADAAICACGDVPLTIENSRINGNRTIADVLSTADVGPMGGALEADAALTIANSQLSGNTVAVTATVGDAGALGAVTLFSGGGAAMTIANSAIADNSATATATNGAAAVIGVGLLNDGALRLDNVRVTGNRGTATGVSGFAQGGGIWNGVLFVPPDSPLTLSNSQVTGNVLTGSPGIDIAGAGIFSAGFPLTLDHVVVAHNAPDQCVGC